MTKEVLAAIIEGIFAVLVAVIGAWAICRKGRRATRRDEVNSGAERYAAAICYRRTGSGPEYLLVRTTGGRWTFPKGAIRENETSSQAAEREAFEEAGAIGVVEARCLTTYLHQKREFKRSGIEQQIDAHLMRVESQQDPLEQRRTPTWFDPANALQRLGEDREFRYTDEFRKVLDAAFKALT